MERFRIEQSTEKLFDDQVIQSVDDFLPFRNEVLEIFKAVAQYSQISAFGGALHRFFEQLMAYTARPENVAQCRAEDWDNFKFFAYELFVCSAAIFIRFERFEFLSTLTTRLYAAPRSIRDTRNEPVVGFDALNMHLASFETRKHRLGSRQISLYADKLIERTKNSIVEAREFCQADFLLYVKSQLSHSRWYPQAWIYIGDHSGTFELFARASSIEYFNRVLVQLLNITDKAQLDAVANNGARFSSGWSQLNPSELMGLNNLATKP
jgi:hypothetical protein